MLLLCDIAFVSCIISRNTDDVKTILCNPENLHPFLLIDASWSVEMLHI